MGRALHWHQVWVVRRVERKPELHCSQVQRVAVAVSGAHSLRLRQPVRRHCSLVTVPRFFPGVRVQQRLVLVAVLHQVREPRQVAFRVHRDDQPCFQVRQQAVHSSVHLLAG